MTADAVKITNVFKSGPDGRTLLRGVSLAIRWGESIRIRGSAYSGRKTLVRLIGGLERPDAGQIHILGRPADEMTEPEAASFRNAHIGYVSNVPGLWEELTVLENVAMPLAIRGASSEEREAAALQALAAVNIGYAAHAYPRALGKDELRLAALARALVTQPDILILDDALVGLEAGYARRFAETVLDYREHNDLAALLLSTGEREDEIITAKTLRMERGEIKGERE